MDTAGRWRMASLMVVLLISFFDESRQGPHERRLLFDLFRNSTYERLERPVANDTEPLVVTLGLTLQQIIDVDEKNQMLTSNVWLHLSWTDSNLAWDREDYGGLHTLRVPPDLVWRPDILMYNSADERFDATYPTNVVVDYTGKCAFLPPGILKSTCKIDILWFPFDQQRCKMKFGSWTFDGDHIDLVPVSMKGDTSEYISNGEWDLLEVPATRNLLWYSCCPAPYVDISFYLHIKRRTMYYLFNLIIPCVIISSMTMLGFTLPPESGEKLTLGVTILLSLTVFLLLVAETMPPTSDAVPLIGIYLTFVMVIVSLSVAFTVIVLNIHHRRGDTHSMPAWVRHVFIGCLSRALFMSMPRRYTRDKHKSVGGSVVDSGYDRHTSDASGDTMTTKGLLSSPADHADADDDDDVVERTRQRENGTLLGCIGTGGGGAGSGDSSAMAIHACNSALGELSSILRELKYITRRLRIGDDELRAATEWQFVAMVLDRACFILFTLLSVGSFCLIMFAAPSID